MKYSWEVCIFPRAFHNNSLCKIWGANRVHYGELENRELGNIKIERQRWPANPLISGTSGTQYVAMVTKLVSSYCGAHLVEFYCKKSSISDTNWLRHLFSSKLGNLHILKTGISLWNKKRYLQKVKRILLLVQTTCLCFKMV